MAKQRRSAVVAVLVVAAVAWAICYYTEQHFADGNGMPIRAISVSEIKAHEESRLVFPGAPPMAAQANAQNRSSLLGLQLGPIVAAQASGIRFDRAIGFSRGNRERFSLSVDAFSGGTLVRTTYTIEPFAIVSLFA